MLRDRSRNTTWRYRESVSSETSQELNVDELVLKINLDAQGLVALDINIRFRLDPNKNHLVAGGR